MMKALFSIVLQFLILTSIHTNAKLSCKDENGKDIDWIIFYKIPRIHDSPEKFISIGEAYAYLQLGHKTGDATKWILSNHSVEEEVSLLGRTYSQILKQKNIAYTIYNDENPTMNENTAGGHVKGMVVTDGKTGFWLSHSIPKFPNDPAEGKYDYPENAKDNGQSGICITFAFKTLSEITKLLKYSRPSVYARKSIPEVNKLPKEISAFFTGKRIPSVRKPPWNITTIVKSIGGMDFHTFSKHKKWNKDLYDDAVAPSLQSSFFVETWRNGAGGKLPSDCNDSFTVYNVNVVDLDFQGSETVSFKRTIDHSKWAVSQESKQHWTCLGDLNRMSSQRKRGGGAVCLRDAPVWKAYTQAVAQYEGCPVPKIPVSRLFSWPEI